MKLIVKARALPLGAVRLHGGRRMKKVAPGQWVPVKKGRYPQRKAPKKKNYYILSQNLGGKLKLSEESVLGKFSYGGHDFIIHHTVDWQGAKPILQRDSLTVTETKSGMRVTKLDNSTVEDTEELAREILERNAAKLDDVINRAIENNPQDILPVKIDPLPDPMTSSERREYAERLADDAYFDDVDDVEGWMDRHMKGLSEEEADAIVGDADDLESDLRVAVYRNMSLSDARDYNEGLGDMYALVEEGRDPSKIMTNRDIDYWDIEDWADRHGIDLQDYAMLNVESEFDANQDYLISAGIEWTPGAMARYAVLHDMSPDQVVQMVEEENENLAQEASEEDDEMKRAGSGLEGTPDYDASRQKQYDIWGDDAVNLLKSSPPIGASVLGGGVNETYRIQFEDENGNYIEGVWKPVTGADDSIHSAVPRGTQHIREAAAYIVDQELGIGLVPPTIIKEIGGVEGSVMEFMPDAYDAPSVRKYPDDVIARAGVLDFVIEHMDRHPGNYMGDGDKLYLIDNGYAFGTRTPSIWNTSPFIARYADERKPIPADVYSRLESLYMSEWPSLEKKLQDVGMDQQSLNRMYSRIEEIVDMGAI